jgi:hypothetical protein
MAKCANMSRDVVRHSDWHCYDCCASLNSMNQKLDIAAGIVVVDEV